MFDQWRSPFFRSPAFRYVQLKYKNGVFRKFAFVGFKKEEDASAAREYFDNTCIGTSRIQVEICSDIRSKDKPRAWSKYAPGSSAYNKLHPEEAPPPPEQEDKEHNEKKNKKTDKDVVRDPKVKELLEKYKDDPQFAEYMETHLGKNSLWSNDAVGGTGDGPAITEQVVEDLQNTVLNSIPDEDLAQAKISDFEYLRRKMVKSKEKEKGKAVSEEKSNTKKSKVISEEPNSDGESASTKKKTKLFYVKVKGLPYKAKRKDVREFLKPLQTKSVRIPVKVKCVAYVGFATEKEANKALIKDRSFYMGKQIFVKPYEEHSETNKGDNVPDRYREQEESLKSEETIAESGRIFVRNLSYLTTEEDITQLFSKYGELSEVLLPIDFRTRKIKGYALVTFLLPEQAVQAYNELDGTVFEGRMLHLLPSKSKPSIDELLEQEGLDFKKKKALLLKKAATASHSWNTLFLGQNAVTNIIAETYNTTKEKVLDDSGKGSVAVRLALGETQIVTETRKFLTENGVQLDAFNKPSVQRSKTILLIKNLPAKTSAAEIRELFEPYGVLGRIILPPTGVTALVEFFDKMEAKKAFLKLAYTKFKDLPLYLEWAPEGSLTESDPNSSTKSTPVVVETNEEKEKTEEEQVEPETTLYLKNLSFNTTEENIRQHFARYGSLAKVTIATKPNPKVPGERLSQGFGFIQYYKKSSADNALKNLQNSELNGHKIEIKRSHRTLKEDTVQRKTVNQAKPTGTKILVRNIPFQATSDEVLELFKVFGEIKTLRLPKKMVGTGSHRGFAFVDYHTKNDAQNAMDSLCQSTHLYGRRLVLEWASPDDEDVDALRKRTAERFAGDEPHSKSFKKGVFDMKTAPKGKGDEADSD
ncbi:probable RNA-binding protein 19 isoform X2 [Thrips palmi]|uniref:Probable RNA-binding protein 19 isoform X2 n=1 Tax=Thrips palmi TaxID=161013 RepID=A0A6P8YUC8_THRPL|nr:probable RNA-binding protein 19 isoform X2 [Thrips palmi]